MVHNEVGRACLMGGLAGSASTPCSSSPPGSGCGRGGGKNSNKLLWLDAVLLVSINICELINECQGRPKGKRHRARVPKRELKALVEEEQSGEPWLGWHKTLILQNAQNRDYRAFSLLGKWGPQGLHSQCRKNKSLFLNFTVKKIFDVSWACGQKEILMGLLDWM